MSGRRACRWCDVSDTSRHGPGPAWAPVFIFICFTTGGGLGWVGLGCVEWDWIGLYGMFRFYLTAPIDVLERQSAVDTGIGQTSTIAIQYRNTYHHHGWVYFIFFLPHCESWGETQHFSANTNQAFSEDRLPSTTTSTNCAIYDNKLDYVAGQRLNLMIATSTSRTFSTLFQFLLHRQVILPPP